MPLRFAEEIILLLLNDDDGRFARVPSWSMDYALAGAVLMDLALDNRIDTDLERLVLVDSTPLGDSLLDPTLADIAAGEERNARYWVEHTANRAAEIREEALNRLVDQGILERKDDRFLWVFQSRRYPMVDGKEEREVRLRLMSILFSDEIPDPRDIVFAEPDGRVRHPAGHVVTPRAQQRSRTHRTGAQAGPRGSSDDAGDHGYRAVRRDIRAAAHLLRLSGRSNQV